MTWRSEACLVRNESTVIHHSHHQQCHMPAARNKAAIGGCARVLLVNMKWLGVPRFRELNDLVARDYDLPEVEDLAHSVILGIPWRFVGHVDRRFIERCASGAGSAQSSPSSAIISTKAFENANNVMLGAVERAK
jgi:hypothetical protein